MTQTTHAIGSRTADHVTITVCGKGGRRRLEEPRTLVTNGGYLIDLHQIGQPPTCKTCRNHSKFQDWSL